MKKIIAAIIVLCGFVLVASADFSLEQWQFQKEIKNVNQGLVDVQLDKEIFAGSSKNLADIRVVDNNNQEIPFKLVSADSDNSSKQYSSKIINNSNAPGKYSMAIMDLGARGIITNSLTVKTISENFQRNITVYGSDNQTTWNVLKANAYIYDYTDKKGNLKTQNTSVSFPDSVFQFIKIEISDSENNPVKIDSISLNQFTKKSAQEFSNDANLETSQDAGLKATILLADLGQGGIPTNKIKLMVSGENFNRAVNIYSSNDKNLNNWRSVGQGYIFRYNTPKFVGENSEISFGQTTDRYLKIVVYNNDNTPLAFAEIKTFAIFRDLVFQAESGKTYRIFYGNSNVNAPQYDLEKYFQYLDLDGAQKASLGDQKINEDYVPEKKPLTEQNKFLIPFLLVFACLILLGLVYKFLKK